MVIFRKKCCCGVEAVHFSKKKLLWHENGARRNHRSRATATFFSNNAQNHKESNILFGKSPFCI